MMIYVPQSPKKGVDFPYVWQMKILFSRNLVDFHPWHFLSGEVSEEKERVFLNKNYLDNNILFCINLAGDYTISTYYIVNKRINIVNCIDTYEGEVLNTF
jgi:hypothetical protein